MFKTLICDWNNWQLEWNRTKVKKLQALTAVSGESAAYFHKE